MQPVTHLTDRIVPLLIGFVEGDGGISIEAAHASRNTTVDGIAWVVLPNHGRTSSSVTPFPRGGNEQNFTAGSGPSLYVVSIDALFYMY